MIETFRKPFLIAEAGINHNGQLKNALKLIDLAKETGFDAVKFQKRNPDISTPDLEKDKMRETPWGYINYLNYKKKFEFGKKEFDKIDKYCKEKKIIWFASAWDIPSQLFLQKYNCKFNKVASAMLTNTKLLHVIAKERKKTFISTGMATTNDIAKAIKIFRNNKCKFTLMHCVSSYPCAEEKLNLNCIKNLKKKFKCPVGYSGHEATVSPSLIAYLLGAEVIERHITLNRSMWGTDQSASLEITGLKTLVALINKVPKILGNGIKVKSNEDVNLLKKFKYW